MCQINNHASEFFYDHHGRPAGKTVICYSLTRLKTVWDDG